MQTKNTAMNQMIFKLDLSVETISVYLLCCSLEDMGEVISTKNLSNVWNSTNDLLNKGLDNLEKKNIVSKIISDRTENSVYKLQETSKWKI